MTFYSDIDDSLTSDGDSIGSLNLLNPRLPKSVEPSPGGV